MLWYNLIHVTAFINITCRYNGDWFCNRKLKASSYRKLQLGNNESCPACIHLSGNERR